MYYAQPFYVWNIEMQKWKDTGFWQKHQDLIGMRVFSINSFQESVALLDHKYKSYCVEQEVLPYVQNYR